MQINDEFLVIDASMDIERTTRYSKGNMF